MEKQENPIRVLQVLGQMDHGGIESIVMNYYRNIDRSTIQFDFAVNSNSLLPQRDEIERLGGRIFLLPSTSNVIQYVFRLYSILKTKKYKVIHCHMNTLNLFPLFSAWCAKVPIRICHNHSTADKQEGTRALVKYILRPFAPLFANAYFACGEYAAYWMYGKKKVKSGKVHILLNAIDIQHFLFDEKTRIQMRSKLGLDNAFVVGHIGRFMKQKNQEFLIDIFFHLYQKNPQARLLILGEGPLEKELRDKIKKLNIEEKVIFGGVHKDVSVYYQSMDVFCLPSLYEGLPVVALEAQANGLPCCFSDTITKQAKILPTCTYCSLEEDGEQWANVLLKIGQTGRQLNPENYLKDKGFSIAWQTLGLKDWYCREVHNEYRKN